MKEKMEKPLRLMKKAAAKMIARDISEWPPNCVLIAYQPIRPQRNNEAKLLPDKVDGIQNADK